MNQHKSPTIAALDENPASDSRTAVDTSLRMTRFDAVTSWFVAVMCVLGISVALMLVVWLLGGKPTIIARQSVAVDQTGQSESPQPGEPAFEAPADDEIEYLTEPTLTETVRAVTEVASRVRSVNGMSSTGVTHVRFSGPPAGGNDITRRWERWELTFKAKGKKDYARQLDHYGIELAAFGGGGPNVIEVASNLSSTPKKRVNTNPKSEERLYFSWKLSNPLLQFDKSLLGSAGIQTSGRNVIRFIPKQLESKLANMEKDYCESKGKEFPGSIAKTVFESNSSENGYEFTIVSQRYRLGR